MALFDSFRLKLMFKKKSWMIQKNMALRPQACEGRDYGEQNIVQHVVNT